MSLGIWVALMLLFTSCEFVLSGFPTGSYHLGTVMSTWWVCILAFWAPHPWPSAPLCTC